MFLNPHLFKIIDDIRSVDEGFKNKVYKKIMHDYSVKLLNDVTSQ